jgi:uncharacterized protein (UPF0262 family)
VKPREERVPTVFELIEREKLEPRNAYEGPMLIAAALLEVAKAIRSLKTEAAQ